jgi:hypothetical protein
LKEGACGVHNGAATPGGGDDSPPDGEGDPNESPDENPDEDEEENSEDEEEEPEEPEGQPETNPPAREFGIATQGDIWVVHQIPEGGEEASCDFGDKVFDGPEVTQDLLNLGGKIEFGSFDLPDSYDDCEFITEDASKGADIQCTDQPKIPCRHLDQSSLCLGNLDGSESGYQDIWVCNE